MIRVPVLAVAVAMAVPAIADAHQLSDTEQFQARMALARELYGRVEQVVVYCESCGDVAPGAPLSPAELDPFAGDSSIGIADVYVRTEPGWYRNLAYLAGFAPEDISLSLRVEPSGTGELITPSDAVPVREPIEHEPPEPEVAPASERLPPAPEIRVVHVHTDPGTDLLAMIALGVSSATASALAWLLLAARRRRRRTLLPKAVDLRE